MAFGAKKLIAVIFLVAGVVLLVLAFQEYGAFGSKLTRAIGKGPSNEVIIYFSAGSVCSVLGLIGVFKK